MPHKCNFTSKPVISRLALSIGTTRIWSAKILDGELTARDKRISSKT